jgi:hypothetical protein
MQNDAATSDERIVYTFPKNAHEEVRAFLATFHGHRLAHIRVFRAGDDDVDYPTRKGIALRTADLPNLKKAVDALLAATEDETA